MHQPTTPNHQNPHSLRHEVRAWACRDAVRTRCEWDEAYSGRAKALCVYEKRKPAGVTLLDITNSFFISLLPPLLASSQSGRQLSRLDFFGTFCIKTKSTERKEHYYAEDERIASRIGMGGLAQIDSSLVSTATFTAKHAANYAEMGRVEDTLRANGLGNVTRLNILRTLKTGAATAEPLAYYYHGDHLGSAAWVTDSGGAAIQHMYYLPFGETFLNQKSTTFSSRYSFSAKEKDEETGYSYFGARYYNSDLSIWLSVDPMADKYPSMSPYAYCANNPVKLVDPDGREFNPIFSTEGKLLGTDNAGWKGTAIVMNKNNFRQGMKHCDAEMKGTYLNRYGKGIKISDDDWEKVEKNGGERMSPSVENHSNKTVYVKPETTYGEYKNDGAYPLAAGKDLYMPVDGVATSKYNDNVGKIPTGASVAITNEGGLNIDYHGFGEMIRLLSDYGWVNRNWQKKQQMNGDHSWDNLFGKAAQIGRRSY